MLLLLVLNNSHRVPGLLWPISWIFVSFWDRVFMYLRLAWNLEACLSLVSAEIKSVHHQTKVHWFFFSFALWDRVSCLPGQVGTCYAGEAGLELWSSWVLGLQVCHHADLQSVSTNKLIGTQPGTLHSHTVSVAVSMLSKQNWVAMTDTTGSIKPKIPSGPS